MVDVAVFVNKKEVLQLPTVLLNLSLSLRMKSVPYVEGLNICKRHSKGKERLNHVLFLLLFSNDNANSKLLLVFKREIKIKKNFIKTFRPVPVFRLRGSSSKFYARSPWVPGTTSPSRIPTRPYS